MFEKARSLILNDRAGARKALADEIKKNERAEIDAELDAIEAEERARVEAKEAEATRAQRAAQAGEELYDVRTRQAEAAAQFDRALASANDAFERLEALSSEAAALESELGLGDGRRPLIAGYARSGALVGAAWSAARPLCKRLGLRRTNGSPANARPLSTLYPQPKENDR